LRDTDAYKPIYKVPTGDDCCGWAEFDNTNADTKEGFVGGVLQGEDATNWGGVSATKFSDLIMTNENYTMFAVVRPDTADDANTKTIYNQRGGKVSGDTTNSNIFTTIRSSGETYNSGYNCASCSPTVESTTTAAFADTDIHLITTVGRAGTNASTISVDQVVLDTETMDTLMNMDFDSQGDQSNVLVPGGAFVSVGYQMTQGNVADAAMALGFKGRIYEIMVYVGDLDANEIQIVEDFLMAKYCIEPTNPADGKGMVGHWDFTKKFPSSNLTQNVDGTNPVDSTGDPIGYAKNFATGETSTGYKLGDFVRASANDATRPTLGTGGQNNHNYANYGAGGTIGLRAGYFTSGDSDDDGGVATNKFSDLTMSSQNYTAWYVVDNVAATGTSAKILDLVGHGQANTDLGQFRLARGTVGSSDPYLRQVFRDDGIGSYPNNQIYLQNNFENPMADGFKIIAVIGDAGPGSTRMFINGTEVYNVTQPSDFDITFSKTSNSGTGSAHVGLGCTTNDAGITSFGWEGKLYEVQVYKGTLDPVDFNNVQTFLENKYNVTQAPVLPVISDCVAHYDFTDANNMFVSREGTGGNPTAGDFVGKIVNTAPGDASGNKLGLFLRSPSDGDGMSAPATRPLFGTDGVNGNSYVTFMDMSLSIPEVTSARSLRAGYFSSAASNADGGISATVFSDLEFNVLSGATIFIVAENDIAPPLLGPMNDYRKWLFSLQGKQSGASSALDQVNTYGAWRSGNNQFDHVMYGLGEPYALAEDPANLSTGCQLYTFKYADAATGLNLNYDNVSIASADTTGWTASTVMHLDSTTTTIPTYFSLGNEADASGEPTNTENWTGKIYEVLVYNKILSATELTNVNNYISSKYGISIS